MNFKRKEKGKKLRYWFLGILAIAAVASIVWLFLTRMEGTPPTIHLETPSQYIPNQADISGRIIDEKSGIRKVFVSLVQEGAETVLMETTYKASETEEGVRRQIEFNLPVSVKKIGLADGKATIRMAAWDQSWRKWFSGNRTYLEQEITIDTTSPQVSVLSRQHNLNQGGSGLVLYRLSESCEKHGIYVGDEFFPGYAGFFKDPEIILAFFALRHDQGADTQIHVEAVDPAGNRGKSGLYYHINAKHFDSETLTISDRFLKMILPAFESTEGMDLEASLLDQFMFINKELRDRNNKAILSSSEQTDRKIHWEGPFLRLPGSAQRASYADFRSYSYDGSIVDREYHLGIDLASTRQAPIPAANNGRIAYVGEIGIYGKVVIIDHGFGLFSLYSHLSRTSVNPGDMVSKADIVGYSGSTGLAGGDHLHFAMFINHVFVNPVEWWDPAWIKNNISSKLESDILAGN